MVIGRSLVQGASSSSCVLIGDISSIGSGSDVAVGIGRNITIGNSCTATLVQGYNNIVNDGSPNNTVIGQDSEIASANQTDIVILGHGDSVWGNGTSGTQFVAVLGSSITVGKVGGNSSLVQAVGAHITVGVSPLNVSCYGNAITVGDTSADVVAIGDALTIAASVDNACVIGHSNSTDVSTSDLVIIGHTNSLTTVSGTPPTAVVCIGNANTVSGPFIDHVVVQGSSNSVSGMNTSTIIGQSNTVVGGGSGLDVIIGDGNHIGTVTMVVVIGHNNTIPDSAGALVAIGNGCSIAPGLGGLGGIMIGAGANLISAGGYAIAIGASASAGNNQCVIGHSDPAQQFQAMHRFIVRGLDVSTGPFTAIDTLNVNDNPLAGSTGLGIVYNSAGTFSNKTVNAAAVTGVTGIPNGSLVLYMNP